MQGISRRGFIGVAAGAAVGTSASAALGQGAAASVRGLRERRAGIDFGHDGIPFTANEFAAQLAELAKGRQDLGDEYSRGGAVARLEAQFAALLGKETAVFMPSGTLANHIAVRTLAGTKRRVIVQEQSHLYNDCGDCAQQLSALTLVPLGAGAAAFEWEQVEAVLERSASGRVPTEVGAISIETPVRRRHLERFEFGAMRRVCTEARKRGIALHLDGARLFVDAAYSGHSPAEYAALFDTVYVSLWKCFNSGSGAILAGSHAQLDELYHQRRMFGGALWNAWPYALVASHHAEGYAERLAAAVRVSERLLELLAADGRFTVERVARGSSLARIVPKTSDLPRFRSQLAEREVALAAPDGDGFWLKVNETLRGASPEDLASRFRASL
jgi:threonine aldolase